MFPMNRDTQSPSFAGVALDRPRIMAIVNVTPDSFSDGGERLDPAQAIDDGLRFVSEGADIVDVGGEFDAAGLAADRGGRGTAAASCRWSRAWPGAA